MPGRALVTETTVMRAALVVFKEICTMVAIYCVRSLAIRCKRATRAEYAQRKEPPNSFTRNEGRV